MNSNTPINEAPKDKFVLGDQTYDKLKFLALVLLPALTTLYFALGQIWHFPEVTETIGTMTAIDTFLGLLLKASTKRYNASEAKYDGAIDVETNEEGTKVFSLVLNDNPENLDTKSQILFKVNGPRS